MVHVESCVHNTVRMNVDHWSGFELSKDHVTLLGKLHYHYIFAITKFYYYKYILYC